MPTDFGNCDWEDLQPPIDVPLSEVTIALQKKGDRRAHAIIWFRGGALAWIESNGPRFNIQISGDAAQLVRVVPDSEGRRAPYNFRDIKKLWVGHVNLWPNENRHGVGAAYEITHGGLVVILPKGFTKPTRQIGINSSLREVGGVKLTSHESSILQILLKRAEVTREVIMFVTHDGPNDDDRSGHAIDAAISRLRAKLLPLEISIERDFGGWFRMNAGSKARLRALVMA